jgi:hypothetical protein
VNYRRHDSEGEAGRLFDELAKHFGENAVFMDVAGIEPGQDFRKAIDQSVASCSVLLAVIGPHWLDAQDDAGERRLNDPGDFVRIELASALGSGIPVIPVLVRSARMPRPEQLPEDLKDLAYRNAVELTHARWKSDVQLLLNAVRPHMGDTIGPPGSGAVKSEPSAGTPELPLPRQAFERRVDSGPATIDAPSIDRVARGLARHLGPIANVLVRRAAQRCSSLDELYEAVSREIASEADRASFLRSNRG